LRPLIGVCLPKIGDGEDAICTFKGDFQCLRVTEVRFNNLVTEFAVLAGIAGQGADVELPTFLKRAHNTAPLIPGCADDGNDLV